MFKKPFFHARIDVKDISEEAEGSSAAVIKVAGKDTKFGSQIKVGDKIRFPQTALGIKVASIEGDESMALKLEEGIHVQYNVYSRQL